MSPEPRPTTSTNTTVRARAAEIWPNCAGPKARPSRTKMASWRQRAIRVGANEIRNPRTSGVARLRQDDKDVRLTDGDAPKARTPPRPAGR